LGVEPRPAGSCRFLDVAISEDAGHVTTKSVIPAMEAVVGAFPDVRVFNLSFGSPEPLYAHSPNLRQQLLINLMDLDNFVFARDAIVVVAAGNTREGVVPATAYPDHHDDPNWALGSWTMGFNTLTCGATVARPSPNGLVGNADYPSAFSRVGPGICEAPVPDYAAFGGDCTPQYRYAPTLGMWVCSADGTWEDHPGTSFAAPLLAREAAFALIALQNVCVTGARPFGVAAKAFLAVTAKKPQLPERYNALAQRTIGRGYASASRLSRPLARSAVVMWQGILESPKDIARVQLPMPRDWLKRAEQPILRLVWAWDPPVHHAVIDLWACRHVQSVVRPVAEGRGLSGSRGAHTSYPLVERTFDVSWAKLKDAGLVPEDDTWIVEVSYEEKAEYYPGIEFSPQQRVAFAAELVDVGEAPMSPQEAIQKLPIAATMIQLGVPRTRIANPVVIKVRG